MTCQAEIHSRVCKGPGRFGTADNLQIRVTVIKFYVKHFVLSLGPFLSRIEKLSTALFWDLRNTKW